MNCFRSYSKNKSIGTRLLLQHVREATNKIKTLKVMTCTMLTTRLAAGAPLLKSLVQVRYTRRELQPWKYQTTQRTLRTLYTRSYTRFLTTLSKLMGYKINGSRQQQHAAGTRHSEMLQRSQLVVPAFWDV